MKKETASRGNCLLMIISISRFRERKLPRRDVTQVAKHWPEHARQLTRIIMQGRVSAARLISFVSMPVSAGKWLL